MWSSNRGTSAVLNTGIMLLKESIWKYGYDGVLLIQVLPLILTS